MCCSLIDSIPPNLDVFYPSVLEEVVVEDKPISRPPMPPSWLIITTKVRGNLYNMRKLLRRRVGDIDNSRITRFGQNRFLIHAKSPAQAAMISNLKIEQEGVLKEIKPHFNFSYAKGIIYNQDMYELPDREILEMCPSNVLKVFKIPNSFMIVLTFHNDFLPPHIYIENERLEIRPYRPRPLQCFNCFGFGLPSKVCERPKLCVNCTRAWGMFRACSLPELQGIP